MAIQVHNHSGSAAKELVNSTSRMIVKSISLTNTDASTEVAVDLYLKDSTSNYYILKNVTLPVGATLVLDGDEISFNKDVYSLWVKLSAGSIIVDIIIRN
jgi:hypothetical protein